MLEPRGLSPTAEPLCCSLCSSGAAQPALLWCHWLLVVKCLRKREPHWTQAECCTFLLHLLCSLFFSGPVFFLVTAAALADPWQINLCLVSNYVFKFTSNVPMSSFVVANVFIAFSVLTEDSIPESASCWRPQGPPASSVEMLHVSTRAAILRQHHQQW